MSLSFPNNPLKSAPKNRNHFILENGISIDSMFPSGNVGSANLASSHPCIIQLRGNTDFKNDPLSRYWLYFRLVCSQPVKKIKFVLKDANHLRRFTNQKINRPKMMYRKQEKWEILDSDLQIKILEDNSVQAFFLLQLQNLKQKQQIQSSVLRAAKKSQLGSTIQTIEKCLFLKQNEKQQIFLSVNHPYTNQDLQIFLQSKAEMSRTIRLTAFQANNISNKPYIYYNEEILTYSVERRKITLITITSSCNILTFEEKQSKINQKMFPEQKNRPFKLKNAPIVLITARVHPSQISSSFFIQGILNQLANQGNLNSRTLLQTFIFMVVPMLNPDGVCNGNYRHDNALKNLNRHYGDSSFQQTPQIKALQLLIDHYRHCLTSPSQETKTVSNRIMMYLDVHGHQSARSSFIFGNYTENVYHMIQNRYFCKLIQSSFIKGGFQSSQCEFSKKNMHIKQKYDENSKLFSGRAYVGSQIQQPEQQSSLTFHAYTLEVVPFFNITDAQNKHSMTLIQYSKELARSILSSLGILFQVNKIPSNSKQCSLKDLRVSSCKQVIIQLQKLKIGQNLGKKYQKKIAQAKNILKSVNSSEHQFFKNSYKTWFQDYTYISTCLKSDYISDTFKQKNLCRDQIRWSCISDFNNREHSNNRQINQQITLRAKNIIKKQVSSFRQEKCKTNISKKTKEELEIIKKQIRQNLKRSKTDDYQNQFLQKISAQNCKKMNLINIGPILIEDIGSRHNQSQSKGVEYQLSVYKRRKYARIKTQSHSQYKQDEAPYKNINLRIYKQSKKMQNRIKTQQVSGYDQKLTLANPVLTQKQKYTSLQPRDEVIRKKIYDVLNKKRSLSMNRKYISKDDIMQRGDRSSQVQIKNDPILGHYPNFQIIQAGFPKLRQQIQNRQKKSQQKCRFLQISQKRQRQCEGSNQYCNRQRSYLNEVKQILKQKRIQIFKQYKQKKKLYQAKDKECSTNIFLVSRFKGFINSSKSP